MKHLFTLLMWAVCAATAVAQNVGIGTANPQQVLDVNGAIRLGNTATDVAGTLRWTGTQLEVYDGTVWQPLGVGDNLGNHIATQVIELNTNWISEDGGAEGIRVNAQGYVGVGTEPAYPFHARALSAPVLDAQNIGAFVGGGSGMNTVGTGPGQTFIPNTTGQLSSATFHLADFFGSGDVTFQVLLYDGAGFGGTLLATSSPVTVPGSAAYADYNFPFPVPGNVVAGNTYTIRCVLVSGTGRIRNTGNVYANGVLYTAAGAPNGAVDLYFRTYIGGGGIDLSFTSNGQLGVGTGTPTARLHVAGTFQLGDVGTVLNAAHKTAHALDLPSIAAGATVTQTFAIAAATVGATVWVSPQGDLEDGIVVASARVSAAGTVQVKFSNITPGAIDPAANTFHITVVQ